MAGELPIAAELLRDARRRAGLTQRQLAVRAGVAQSVISAYESGRRKPALATMQRLIGATGYQLRVDLVAAVASAAPTMSGDLGQRVRRHRDEILNAAAELGARNVRVFGSVARGDEHPCSDVDFLVDLERPHGLFTLMRLERDLSELLGTNVEVIPADSLKPDVLAAAERDAVPV